MRGLFFFFFTRNYLIIFFLKGEKSYEESTRRVSVGYC